jgi:hypothetical protein
MSASAANHCWAAWSLRYNCVRGKELSNESPGPIAVVVTTGQHVELGPPVGLCEGLRVCRRDEVVLLPVKNENGPRVGLNGGQVVERIQNRELGHPETMRKAPYAREGRLENQSGRPSLRSQDCGCATADRTTVGNDPASIARPPNVAGFSCACRANARTTSAANHCWAALASRGCNPADQFGCPESPCPWTISRSTVPEKSKSFACCRANVSIFASNAPASSRS